MNIPPINTRNKPNKMKKLPITRKSRLSSINSEKESLYSVRATSPIEENPEKSPEVSSILMVPPLSLLSRGIK